VFTTQQYGTNGIEFTNTVTYDYSGIHLASMSQENNDGIITTHYSNYTTAGLYQQKTVSASNCPPRTETYTYDNTQRFVTQITNPLLHSATYTNDPKTGNKTSETNANGLTTAYTYNKLGNLTKITHSDGTITKDTVYWYSGTTPTNAKYCTKTTSSGQADLIVYYDVLGREVCRLDDGYYFDTRYNDKIPR
jgi:YD repeat-containing protein